MDNWSRLFDAFRVSTSLCRFIFESPKVNDALLFMTILSTDLKALRRRGYNSMLLSKLLVLFRSLILKKKNHPNSRQDSAPAEGRTRSSRKGAPSVISLELGNSSAGYTNQDSDHGNDDLTTSDLKWYSDQANNGHQPRANL